MRWVAEYERAWREGDVSGVVRLFTDDARHRRSPYEEPAIGHEDIQAFWLVRPTAGWRTSRSGAYWPGKPYSAG